MIAKGDNQPIEFIRLPEVRRLTSLGTTKIYEMANKGQFPKQVKLGGRSVAWVKSEVLAWSHARVKASRESQDGTG
jgi:prophage regulatory protein